MPSALAIQHVAFEDTGYFGEFLAGQGYSLRSLEAPLVDLNPLDPLREDLWIVLGGPIGVYDMGDYPFINAELEILRTRLQAGRPTLGICLGCQLMAAALGARVYPSGTRELGWGPIQLSEAGRQSCLRELEGLPVLHWHGDTFDLPPQAELLASTDCCAQAFRLGNHALGLQFHVEVTARDMERWFVGHTLEISQTPGVSVPALRADTARYAEGLRRAGQAMLREWLG